MWRWVACSLQVLAWDNERREARGYVGARTSNYARLLAQKRGLALTDVSCSGATARQVLEGGPFGRPSQVDALHPETMLVTLTAGGNDVSYIRNLLAWSRQDNAATDTTSLASAAVQACVGRGGRPRPRDLTIRVRPHCRRGASPLAAGHACLRRLRHSLA